MGGQRVALRRESLDRGAARRDLMTPLVSFRNVSCRLGGKDVLRGLSLDVEAGETLVLLGRSGSGKTTALKMVNALLLPSAGEVRVEGTPTVAWDAIRLRRRIGLSDGRFGALDPGTRVELQRQFLALRREIGKTAIFVTHDVREALLVATRIALLHDGRLAVLAAPAEFLRAQGEEVHAFLACLDTQVAPA